MRIILTGVPGTGKTVLCEALAKKLKLRCIKLNDIVEQYKMYFYISKKDGSKVVDIKKLEDYVTNHLTGEDDYIVEGHLACEFYIPADIVIVLRAHPNTIKRRLAKRDYPKEKTNNNVMCEVLDYCVIASSKSYRVVKMAEVNTTNKRKETVVKEIIDILDGKRKPKHIDWSSKMYKTNVNFIKELENR